ncbi:multidrug effflux MFS transporter [Salinispora arenicola]|uniref:multidrug effflux MFS transporter n=1 Tax=Salinispora arenicola TaxID=168697 RepID=UPI0003664407|nr:multidrug effflux MFS transporter [Salinispora arenicola]
MTQTAQPTAPDVATPAGKPQPAEVGGGLGLLLLLGAITAIGPLSLDMYLPALPTMAHDLDASQAQIQLSLTTCLVGLALGQFVTGPLSDRWGRRRPVLIGLGAYAVLALACAAAPSAPVFTALRFAQGFAGGMGAVVTRAVVRDLYSGRAAAKYFSRLTLVFGLAPIAAPTAGSLVLRFGSWRALFVLLAVVGALLTAIVAARLPETLPAHRRSNGGLSGTVRSLRTLFTDRVYLGYTLTQGLAFAGLFAYISGSSFVFQDVFDLSASAFGLLFGLNALAFVVVGQANARLLDRFPPRTLLVGTLGVSAVAAVGVLAGAVVTSQLIVMGTLLVFIGSLGMVMPNGTALALDRHAHHAGTAAALMGALQSVIGALAAPLVGLGGEGSAVPMAGVLAASAVLSLAAALTLARPERT